MGNWTFHYLGALIIVELPNIKEKVAYSATCQTCDETFRLSRVKKYNYCPYDATILTKNYKIVDGVNPLYEKISEIVEKEERLINRTIEYLKADEIYLVSNHKGVGEEHDLNIGRSSESDQFIETKENDLAIAKLAQFKEYFKKEFEEIEALGVKPVIKYGLLIWTEG